MKDVFVHTFPSNESHNAFNRERSTVDKITIKKIFIVDIWISIDLKDIHDIVVLAMDISTNSYFFLILNFVLYKGIIAH